MRSTPISPPRVKQTAFNSEIYRQFRFPITMLLDGEGDYYVEFLVTQIESRWLFQLREEHTRLRVTLL